MVAFAFLEYLLAKRYGVYVDGFNLYNRCVKGTAHKWLDLRRMIENLQFEAGEVVLIKYFTARLIPHQGDLNVHVRQNIYLRALRTIPQLTIYFGQFRVRKVTGQRMSADGEPTGKLTTIRKFEEKGSDVNLASHMLADAFLNRYDAAILVSNDSDLAGTIDLIREHTRKPVGLAATEKFPTVELEKRCAFKRVITESILAVSQFTDSLDDGKGRFRKPREWP